MQLRQAWFLTALLILLLATGCRQTQLIAPPPSFEPPRVEAPARQLPNVATPSAGKSNPTAVPAQAGLCVIGGSLVPRASPRPWKYIVIHHSDTPTGAAARFDRAHRARGWDMLGYDFVIGNGTESPDGAVEVGPRWPGQMIGAHTGTPDLEYNKYGIGICLVGNFDVSRPTSAQMDTLVRLCAYFMKTYRIPASNILGHRDCKPTDCPGRNMDIQRLRRLAGEYAKRK